MIGGVEFPIYPMTLENVKLLTDAASGSQEKRSEALIEMIFWTLRKGDPEMTDEEMKSLSIEIMDDVTTAVLDVNGLSDKVIVKKQEGAQ